MEPMGWGDYFIVLGCCAITMLVCRVVPLFVLKGKELPEGVGQALGFIPPAAFAALVANDLLTPGMFDAGLWPAAAPLIAALAVALVAWKTKSLLWCAVSGVAAYALLMLLYRPCASEDRAGSAAEFGIMRGEPKFLRMCPGFSLQYRSVDGILSNRVFTRRHAIRFH